MSTTSGLKWFLRINNHEIDLDEDEVPTYNITVQYNTSVNASASFELTTGYYYESLMLLGIPIFIAGFFTVLLFIFFGFLIYSRFWQNRGQFGRNGEIQRFEDEDQAYAEEVAETYMRLLEPVVFSENSKYLDCSICLKEFEKNEGKLMKIPNCEHVFHEACLKKWFLQA